MDLTQLYTHPSQWIKRLLVIEGKRCLLGQLIHYNSGSADVDVIAKAAYQMFPERIHCEWPNSVRAVIQFNDDNDTTFEDVQKVLQQAEHIKNLPKGAQ